MKEIIWYRKTLKLVSNFPEMIKRDLGYQLYRLQLGELLTMPHSRPMSTVANGCDELRIKGEDGAYRVFYLLSSHESIIVFHAFQKKTQRTPNNELELARKNLKELM